MNALIHKSHLYLLLFVVVLTTAVAATVELMTGAEDAGIVGNTWQHLEIGEANIPRPVSEVSGSHSLTSSGLITSNVMDSLNYQYLSLNGNAQMVARIVDERGLHSLAGLMLRETLAANARGVGVFRKNDGSIAFHSRMKSGGLSEQEFTVFNSPLPFWVKLVRQDDWICTYSSLDGQVWNLVNWRVIQGLRQQVYVGLALGNSDAGTSHAVFDSVSVVPGNAPIATVPLVGTGDGLSGSYYGNRHLHGAPLLNRVDGTIDFDFLSQASRGATNDVMLRNHSLALLGKPKVEEFGARWTGEIQAQYTEPYTLSVESDDGARVWLNEQLIVDDWLSHNSKESSATVNLVAGQRYLLRIEYFQNRGVTRMSLRWSSPSTPRCVIPESQLYSVPTDRDGNGLPDLWEEHYFGRAGINREADQDADGLSHLQEYRRHTDPTNPFNWGVPDDWMRGDIEEWGADEGSRGAASYSNGEFVVSSAGAISFWSEMDNLHYVYKPIGTNGEIVARILSVEGTNAGSEGGVMIRESLASSARSVGLMLTPSNGVVFHWRQADGKIDQHSDPSIGESPYWLKLSRDNDWIGGYVSSDGTNWTLFGWQTFKELAPRVFVGLASASLNGEGSKGITTARFDQVDARFPGTMDPLKPLVGEGDGLRAEYRNDSLLYLPGATNRVDPQVNFWWSHAPPLSILNHDSYGVCWSGEVQAQFTETYTFYLNCRSQDWVRLWINDRLLLDGWRNDQSGWLSGTLDLVRGQRYLIRVEMFNNHDKGAARLIWSSPSTNRRIIPQSQLYSQPLDADGNGLPDSWETVHFGHTSVNPAADPDEDHLTNLEEYQFHTNPLRGDTDTDGIPDSWEVAHGLDPQFKDADFDYDNTGWSNLDKYLYDLDPYVSDANGNGLPDSFEIRYLDSSSTSNNNDVATVAVELKGNQAVDLQGEWAVDGDDIHAVDRRGGLSFSFSLEKADKYILNIMGTQNRPNPWENKFKLLLYIDGQELPSQTLISGYGTNGVAAAVLPYLHAGAHVLRVFWDNPASHSSLRIKRVKLLTVKGGDLNRNGIKDWAEKMIADESGADETNRVISSYVSPICLEGRDPYLSMMRLTVNNDITNGPAIRHNAGERWFSNIRLSAQTNTTISLSYQNKARVQAFDLKWIPLNLLNAVDMTVRLGDSLRLTALPAGSLNGDIVVRIGTNLMTGRAASPIKYNFNEIGTFTVTGTFTANNGATETGAITITVVDHKFASNPDCWVDYRRNWNVPGISPSISLEFDSRLQFAEVRELANDRKRFRLVAGENKNRYVVSRIGSNGAILDSAKVKGFDLWSGGRSYTRVAEVFEDGSSVVEMLLILSPVLADIRIELNTIVAGVMFEDGTISKLLTAADFDAIGQCKVRFLRPAGTRTAVCHEIKVYQGDVLLGHRR